MYTGKKFRIKKIETIVEELKQFRRSYKYVKRIFLADGDAFIPKTKDLMTILEVIKDLFPECERVSSYATPKDILNKSLDDIRMIQKAGLTMLYMGVESGSDKILADIKKGVTAKEIMEAGIKAKQGGMVLSVTVISGIAGKENWELHALETAKVISKINPDYLGLLTLMVEYGTELARQIQDKELTLLTPQEVMIETHLLIKNLELESCVFRSNHASNYVPLSGVLSRDKDKMLKELTRYIKEDYNYKDERYRGL